MEWESYIGIQRVYIQQFRRSLLEYTMNRNALFNRIKRERSNRNAISPIIATLLLILIAIAAGVVVYAYVLGFVGNSTSNTGNSQSVISVDNFCISVAGSKCGATTTYVSLTIRNVGTTTIASGTNNVNVYLTDVTSGTSATYTCSSTSTSPGSTMSCNDGSSVASIIQGDTVSLKVVMPDGGTASSSTKALA